MNTDNLKAFRSPTKTVKLWTPPSIYDFQPGRIIAFDPSISATGVVAVRCTLSADSKPHLLVYASETFKTDEVKATGHEGNLQRTLLLRKKISQWMSLYNFATDWQVVHEMPPVNKAKMLRPESSLLAGYAVREATQGYILNPMIGRQAHAKFTCGNGNAEKKVHHEAIKKLIAEYEIESSNLITNESKRDGLSIALHWLANR